MFSDSLTITINAQAKTFVAIRRDGYSSEYFLREPTGEYRLHIRNSVYTDKKRSNQQVDRHNFELVHTLHPVAPQIYGVRRKTFATVEIDRNDTIVDSVKHAVGAVSFLTEANLTKMANNES